MKSRPDLKLDKRRRFFASLPGMATILALSMALAWTDSISSSQPEQRGLAIAIEADKHDAGWMDWSANAQMILKNKQGQTSSRRMQMKALEQNTDGDKRIIFFDQPRDVKGTAFLVFTKKQGNDDQWLFLPALKRVKRISSKNQSGPFVGSEFAYEDLSSQEVEKYTYKYLRDEAVDGMRCYVLERTPVNPKSGYTRQVVWIDQDEYRTLKIDYFDRKQSLLKTLTATGFQSYGKDYWRADHFLMVNHQTGKSTELLWTDYQFTRGLKEREFTQTGLRNAR